MRFHILCFVILFCYCFLFFYFFYIQIIEKKQYEEKVLENSINTYEGMTAPRGRIYDRNGILLVDNEPEKIIYYKKQGLSVEEEIELATKMVSVIEIEDKVTSRMLKDFWIAKNPNRAKEKITQKEMEDLSFRKISLSDIEELKRNRITESELKEIENTKVAYLYYLMNQGYSYLEKVIKKDVSDEEYAYIATNEDKLKGFHVRLDWKRVYPFSSTFQTILGSVKVVPSNLEKEYLKKGYNKEDRVGVSYLEYQYDDYLRGIKDVLEHQKDKDILKEEGKRGNDIYLTIDINLQKEVDDILESEMKKAKKEANTKYYDRSFVVVVKPKTGEILAMSGKIIKEEKGHVSFYDYTPGVFTSSYPMGSTVKGASHIVGYNTGALKIGEVRYDNCVKLASTPLKCSWKSLGRLNDITALKYSSNTYQFYTAMKVSNYHYQYNGSFPFNKDSFKTYRDTFASFGLGSKTGIDLPNEFVGIKGKNDTSGLLLDFSIGQYDTYTPIQLAQYISTIANDGKRVELHLLNKVENEERILYESEVNVLNEVKTEEKYLKRVQKGFKEVLTYGGTGYGYIDLKYKPAGKTGTSESFVDSNSDGVMDKQTLSHAFVAYAPYDDVEVAFAIISPNVYYGTSSYTSSINKRITKRVSEAYFKLYS